MIFTAYGIVERGYAVFSFYLHYYDAHCLFYLLDGAQYKRVFKLFRSFYRDFCRYMDHTVYHLQAQCEQDECKSVQGKEGRAPGGCEKIIELRRANGMTQEELASICGVSRQSISK